MGQVLFVVHVDHPRLGWLPQWANRHFDGHAIIFAQRQRLPNVDELTGPVIVMGGPMGVGDLQELPWLAKEREWLGELMQRRWPVLGICLGAQLMAHALGHRVQSCPLGSIECGYHRVHSEHGLPAWVYHWHRDGILLDRDRVGAPTCLGVSEWQQGRASQAFIHGCALGVQFHPEVDPEMIQAWLARDAADLARPGARPANTHLDDHAQHGGLMRQWLETTLQTLWSTRKGHPDGRITAQPASGHGQPLFDAKRPQSIVSTS